MTELRRELRNKCLLIAVIGIFLLMLLNMGCSQLKRVEKDLYSQLPEGETINFTVEACYFDLCIEGKADTLSGAFDDLARQIKP